MDHDATPQGWYPDPSGAFDQRYWDGAVWTDQVSPAGAQSAGPSFGPWKVLLLVSALAAAVAVVVGGVALAVEFRSEQQDLANYRAAVEKESSRRVDLLKEYQARDKALRQVVTLQEKVDDLVATMKKSDCYGRNPCDGAVAWNANDDKLTQRFDKLQALKKDHTKAVGVANNVAQPDDLWLLSMLGKDDSADVKAELERLMPEIRKVRAAINASIADITEWNASCKPSELFTCDGEYIWLDAEV